MLLNRDDSEDDISHDRWLVSYADFMTLLMAFFVVMYSISQVSEEKYRVLSDTFNHAFRAAASEPVLDTGEPRPSHTLSPIDMSGTALQDRPGNDANEVPDNFVRISESLQQSFETLMDDELITVTGDERWLQIELQAAILFDSGGAVLSDAAQVIIGELSKTLVEHNNVIRVEGFTDDVPISTPLYDSNWELSAARASAVVRLLEQQGISPERLAATGYGEHQPTASNVSEEGRAKNRRIVLMVSTSERLRPAADTLAAVASEDSAADVGANVDSGLVRGVALDARAQAQRWLERFSAADQAPAGAGSSDAEPVNVPAGANERPASDGGAGTDSTAGEQPDAAASAESLDPSIQRVVTERGGLLFTN